MASIEELQKKIIKFRDDRDWKQFHTPKDSALSLSLEASEYLELFQWRNGDDLEKYIADNKEMFGDELSDILYWVLLISHDLNIDINEAFEKKLIKTGKKYPINQVKGKASKYNSNK